MRLTEKQREFLTMVQEMNAKSVCPRGGIEDVRTIRSLIIKDCITFDDGRCRITETGRAALGSEAGRAALGSEAWEED